MGTTCHFYMGRVFVHTYFNYKDLQTPLRMMENITTREMLTGQLSITHLRSWCRSRTWSSYAHS
jgi:hypothetical protein